ncbi:MAG: glycosyltransferase, partial [Lachnospiraceae bacterium]|nr:glycosyltransferase [Lachnospiraceae bacterium]
GFRSGEALTKLIREARFTVYPSEWYENCPFSVMESLVYGTPVLGADIGGIPELIRRGKTGDLFPSGDRKALKNKILELWNDRDYTTSLTENCRKKYFDTTEEYAAKLMEIYTS